MLPQNRLSSRNCHEQPVANDQLKIPKWHGPCRRVLAFSHEPRANTSEASSSRPNMDSRCTTQSTTVFSSNNASTFLIRVSIFSFLFFCADTCPQMKQIRQGSTWKLHVSYADKCCHLKRYGLVSLRVCRNGTVRWWENFLIRAQQISVQLFDILPSYMGKKTAAMILLQLLRI